MADFDNFSEINENFNTIKTLLNSIRAQGILNTSDVDKLLSGINNKLERIDTEEDIDLIKVFLSELKQTLDERHNVLLSKFGAIESLFTNLLKNNSEMLKSSEVKEIFDIIATNLSVLSREVVSQKESLSDMVLRMDSLRSDDTQSKDIIKNISLLKNDFERLNNGFDSIVLSLNDNFKTIIKTIASYDKTDYLDKFADVLSNIEMSSNTVLSALQMLDKKTSQVEVVLGNVATKDDISAQNEHLQHISVQNKELADSVSELSGKYLNFDSLSEKIDASVNIIAGLKSVLSENNDQNAQNIIEEFNKLQTEVLSIKSEEKFAEFKTSLENMLRNVVEATLSLDKNLDDSFNEIQKVADIIKGLDISVNFQELLTNLGKTEISLKSHVDDSTEKIASLHEVNITRVLNSISEGANALSTKLNETQVSVAELCERNFNAVFENVTDLKNTIRQLDETSVASNNAILSNITDRLSFFENSLKSTIETQEKTVSSYSAQLNDQVENIKNLANVLDYKMESSLVESGSVKREFSDLKTAVENVLALDFVNVVKDLKVDLYAAKQDIANSIDNSSNVLSEKITEDLYSKYELLISKLDTVEDEFKNSQSASLAGIKSILENISSSIVDVLSYVSTQVPADSGNYDIKLSGFSDIIKENSINYIENVRDIVDVIKVQVEANLKEIQEETSGEFDSVKRTISETSEALKNEIKSSYSKLLELQNSYQELKDILSSNSASSDSRIDGILDSANVIKFDFDTKLTSLKNELLNKISDYKQEFVTDNADRINELKLSVQGINPQSAQEVLDLLEEIKLLLSRLSEESSSSMTGLLAKILENFVSLKSLINTLNDKYTDALAQKVDLLLNDFSSLKTVLDKVDENVDGDMTRQLSIIESNFESLVSQITILFDKSDKSISERIEEEFSSISGKMQTFLAEKLEEYKAVIERSFDALQSKNDSQAEFVYNKIADINSAIKGIFEEQADDNLKQLDEIAVSLKSVIEDNVKLTAVDYCALKTKLNEFAKNIETNNQLLTQELKAQLSDITKYINSVREVQSQEASVKQEELNANIKTVSDSLSLSLANIEANLNSITENNNKLSADVVNALTNVLNVSDQNFNQLQTTLRGNFADLTDLKSSLSEFVKNIESNNQELTQDLKIQLDSIAKYISSVKEVQAQDAAAKHADLSSNIKNVSNAVNAVLGSIENTIKGLVDDNAQMVQGIENLIGSALSVSDVNYNNLQNALADNHTAIKESLKAYAEENSKKIAETVAALNNLVNHFDEDLGDLTTSFDKGISGLGNNLKVLADENGSKLTRIETSVDNIKNNVDLKINAMQDTVSTGINSVKNSIRDLSDLNSARMLDLASSMSEVKSVLEDQYNSAKTSAADISVLTHMTANNGVLVETLANRTEEQHEDVLLHTQNILDTLKSVDGAAVERNSELMQQSKNILDFLKDTDSCAVERSQQLVQHIDGVINNSRNITEELKENQEKIMNRGSDILTMVKTLDNNLKEQTNYVNGAKADIINLSNLVDSNKSLLVDLQDSLEEKVNTLLATSAEISAGELQTIDSYVNHLTEQLEAEKQTVISCKDLLVEFLNKELKSISQDVEKETDVIIGELIDQFDILKKSQTDEAVKLTSQIEDIVSTQIYNNIEDLKSFFDIKTDTSVMLGKLDNLKTEMAGSVEKMISNLNKLLDTNVFKSDLADYKVAVELLINSSIESLNDRIEEFISKNLTDIGNLIADDRKSIEDKLALFDKKFIDTVVDKYEEIKLISNKYGDSFDKIEKSVSEILNDFRETRAGIEEKLSELSDAIKASNASAEAQIDKLQACFENLQSQISSKSFDEAFQSSINNQISGLEDLVNEQLSYIEDISELCCNNLPDVTEINTLLKHSVLKSIEDFSEKLENQNIENKIELGLKEFKSDIITQFLNVFNQISFVTEQEEILDFIQDKHNELITILSHIVTSADTVENINENVVELDNKIGSIKNDLDNLNEKINSVISSEGDIDYVYSLQDLESDIANLRLVLNEMKGNNHEKEFSELISSTDKVYKLVEAIKSDMPGKKDIEDLSEDLVSISTRTNKLILSSDESYRALQDNLQDFKLVINDLDERTKNFPKDAGIDKIDSKLNAIKTMMVNGTKTNQVFNQIFEYLAEWVDNASVQINSISDKIETLDEIEQIKLMLTEIKAGAEDNTESIELVEALESVFDKQTRRISSLEAKLDKIIVETTIISRNNKLDMAPMEDTLNKFLVAVDEKMSAQQDKIKSLESKLEGALELLDAKDTAQLTKKVGGMDRQIAKLNKSIEKIASHVVEK